VLLSASPIRDGQGQIIGIARTLRDIGERQAFEQQRALLSDIVASSSDAIISYALDGTITSWNRAAENMYGFSANEMIGSNFFERIVPIVGPGEAEIEREIGRKVAAGERTLPFEATRTRKDGKLIYVLVSVSPIRGVDGAIVGASRMVRDLSERKDYELRLEAMRQDMIHVARMHELSLVSAGIAHEINQPLSAIVNYSNAARRLVAGSDFAKLPEIAQKIGEQAERASQIVLRMRAFVEKRAPHRSIEDLNAIANDAVALALIGARTASTETKFEYAPDAPPVMADRVQIQQVLVNLLRNAVEAMSETARRVLALVIRECDDGFVEVSVSDTGCGIPEHVAERLFTPFVTTKAEGMGIGLAISKTIIEAHGGTLSAHPNPGGGTIFRFTLPAAEYDQRVRESA
jgi:two-component system sensor kinase FixL